MKFQLLHVCTHLLHTWSSQNATYLTLANPTTWFRRGCTCKRRLGLCPVSGRRAPQMGVLVALIRPTSMNNLIKYVFLTWHFFLCILFWLPDARFRHSAHLGVHRYMQSTREGLNRIELRSKNVSTALSLLEAKLVVPYSYIKARIPQKLLL